MLLVEQSVSEYNIRSTVFWKYHTNWDNVSCAVSSFTWRTILNSPDPLDAFDRAISEDIGRLVPTPFFIVDLETSNGLMPLRRTYDANHTAYRAWCRARRENHLGRFVIGRAGAQRVYGATRDSHYEHTRNTLTQSTCSNNWSVYTESLDIWCEALREPEVVWRRQSIPALRGSQGRLEEVVYSCSQGTRGRLEEVVYSCSQRARGRLEEVVYSCSQGTRGRLAVAPAGKASQCWCYSSAFQTLVIQCLLLDVDTYGCVD